MLTEIQCDLFWKTHFSAIVTTGIDKVARKEYIRFKTMIHEY